MTKKTRTTLFIVCLFLFLLIAPSAIFYSQGYRFDFGKKKIVQTGGLYLKCLPKSAQTYLDGKPKEKTGILTGTVLIENLFPKKYNVKIEKEGYHSWEKTLEIKEKQVTEAKNIILIPQNPDFTFLTNKVENLFFSPDEKKVILKEVYPVRNYTGNEKAQGDQISNGAGEERWALKLYDLERKVKSHLIGEEEISEKKVDLLDLKFSLDLKSILLTAGTKEQVKYFIVELNDSPKLTPIDFLGQNISEISFHPQDSQKIIFIKNSTTTNSLSEADRLTKKISRPILDDVVSFIIFDGNIFWLDPEGFVFRSDFSGKKFESLNLKPLSIIQEVEYQIFVQSSRVFLKEGDRFYLLDQESKSFEKIFEPIKDMKFSPDFKKAVYFNNFEIWVLFLDYDPFTTHKKGDRVFLTRFSEKIGEIFWLTSRYLIFNVGGKIKIAEIDDRDRINIVDLADFENPRIFFNTNDKKLYVLSNGVLYVSKKLLP